MMRSPCAQVGASNSAERYQRGTASPESSGCGEARRGGSPRA